MKSQMLIKYINGQYCIPANRIPRLLARSYIMDSLPDKETAENFEMSIEREMPWPETIEMFEYLLDCDTVWDFLLRYRFIRARDIDPFVEDGEFPTEIVRRVNIIDDFEQKFNNHLQFYWLMIGKPDVVSKIDIHEYEIPKRYKCLPEINKVPTGKFEKKNNMIIFNVPDYVLRKVNGSKEFPYRCGHIYNYVFSTEQDDLIIHLANVDRQSDCRQTGLVNFNWDVEFAEHIRGIDLVQQLKPQYCEPFKNFPGWKAEDYIKFVKENNLGGKKLRYYDTINFKNLAEKNKFKRLMREHNEALKR